jgi:thiosulfate reductase cytochrome b subunit
VHPPERSAAVLWGRTELYRFHDSVNCFRVAVSLLPLFPLSRFLLSATYRYATIAIALAMAESGYMRAVAIRDLNVSDAPRHSGIVRITHWITTISFFGLLVSGIGILLAHPRFYWGETGGVGAPSLFDLPLPFMLDGPSSWGRSLHFLSAWVCVLTGLLYVVGGMVNQHFRRHLLPAKSDLSWRSFWQVVLNHLRLKRPTKEEGLTYNVLQRLTYLVVVFALFPLMIWTGLAMSPGITSVFPAMVNVLGGQQCARTIHFFVAIFLVLFVVVHIAMVCLAGFKNRVGALITGHSATGRECP